jgi:hypothetical protein
MTDKTKKLQAYLGWFVLGVIILGGVGFATTLTEKGLSIEAQDSVITLHGYNSLLGGSPSSGGLSIIQDRPEAKSGIYWTSWDNATAQNTLTGWLVCHYNSSSNSAKHSHCAIETLTSTGMNTHFAVDYGSELANSQVSVYDASFSVSNLMNMSLVGNSKVTPKGSFDIYPNNQSTIALRVSNTTSALALSGVGTSDIQMQDNVTITTLSGSGDAFACLDANGKLFRSATACA